MEKYEQISVVGEGSYGLVMKCKHRETDQVVAVKKFLETEEDATIRKMALREIRMLKRLKHENLVTMIEVFRHRKRFYIVFEYLEGTVLDELDKLPGGLGDERSRERIFQVVRAISYCHSNHIIHRDVKPENVLVSSLGVVKLCDFGFARIICSSGEACTEYVATRWYRAPELLVGEPHYGTAVDIWAIGCLFAEMMTGDPLFPGESDIDQLFLVVKMLGRPCIRHQQLMSKNTELRTMIKSPSEAAIGFYQNFPTWSLQSIDFLNGCMKMDPHQRLTAEELLKLTYFTHDRFPLRFLPALREKVNIEFNNPLLRKFKTEILMSTDKKDESKSRRSSNDIRWKFTLTEGSMKRKFSCDAAGGEQLTEKNQNLITLAKTSQRLSVMQKSGQGQLLKQGTLQVQKEKTGKNLSTPKLLQGSNNAEMQMLEKSLESLAKFNNKTDENRPVSANKEETTSPLLPDSPPPFQSLHFGFGDYSKSPTTTHAMVLHPSINNISFTKDPSKRSPNVLQSINCNMKTSQVPLYSKTHFLKKLDRNAAAENIFGNGDQGSQVWNNAPLWFNSFCTSTQKRKEVKPVQKDVFCLPNLPGATTSPNKTKKKSLPEIELPHSNNVSPRIQSSSSHHTTSSPSKHLGHLL